MSIRHFSNQPCPVCQRDTTHYKMQCRECGHVNLSQADQMHAAILKKHRQIIERYGRVNGRNCIRGQAFQRGNEEAKYIKETGQRIVP